MKNSITSNHIQLYQIFYNEETRRQVVAPFIPLDNSQSLHPEWFEFWAIKHFLDTHTLEDDVWYAFLSPKFSSKTGLSGQQVCELVQADAYHHDVYLLTGCNQREQLALFLNPFEQGEFWHKGLYTLSQQICDTLNWDIQLNNLVCGSHNFTFCNYILAKKSYWLIWKQFADALFDYAQTAQDEYAPQLHQQTYHTPHPLSIKYAMKVFIQERLPAIIFHKHHFNLTSIDNISYFGSELIRPQTLSSNALLHTCYLLKSQYTQDGNLEHIRSFLHIRKNLLNFSFES